MTSPNFKKFISGLRSVSLTIEEKDSLRSEFLKRTGMEHVASPIQSRYFIFFRYAKIFAYSFALFIVGISPIAFAAENSVPGDILYPIKEAVNLPVKKQVENIVHTIKGDKQKKDISPQANTDQTIEVLPIAKEQKKIEKIIKKETPAKIKKVAPAIPGPTLKSEVRLINKEIKETLKEIDATHKKNEKELKSNSFQIEDVKDSTNDRIEKKIEDVKETKDEIKNEVEKSAESTVDKVKKNIDLSL